MRRPAEQLSALSANYLPGVLTAQPQDERHIVLLDYFSVRRQFELLDDLNCGVPVSKRKHYLIKSI
jgi:hypothetical protein